MFVDADPAHHFALCQDAGQRAATGSGNRGRQHGAGGGNRPLRQVLRSPAGGGLPPVALRHRASAREDRHPHQRGSGL